MHFGGARSLVVPDLQAGQAVPDREEQLPELADRSVLALPCVSMLGLIIQRRTLAQTNCQL